MAEYDPLRKFNLVSYTLDQFNYFPHLTPQGKECRQADCWRRGAYVESLDPEKITFSLVCEGCEFVRIVTIDRYKFPRCKAKLIAIEPDQSMVKMPNVKTDPDTFPPLPEKQPGPRTVVAVYANYDAMQLPYPCKDCNRAMAIQNINRVEDGLLRVEYFCDHRVYSDDPPEQDLTPLTEDQAQAMLRLIPVEVVERLRAYGNGTIAPLPEEKPEPRGPSPVASIYPEWRRLRSLIERLVTFARHKDACASHTWVREEKRFDDCNCGLDQLKREIVGAERQSDA